MPSAANLTTDTVKKAYEDFSSKASDIIRQLSLAGIALVWIFKTGTDTTAVLQPQLRQAAFFIFIALVMDLFQYLAGAGIWFVYFRIKEKQRTAPTTKFEAPVWINWPVNSLFVLKALFMIIAYVGFIVPYLFCTFYLPGK
jgi:hypothetical protein